MKLGRSKLTAPTQTFQRVIAVAFFPKAFGRGPL